MYIKIKSHRSLEKAEKIINMQSFANFTEGVFYLISDEDWNKIKHLKSITKAAPKHELINTL